MTYRFLTDLDIHTLLKEEFKGGLAASGASLEPIQTFILRTEAAAIRQICNKIKDKFDVAMIFTLPAKWDAETAYVKDARVIRNDEFYIALKPTTGDDPENCEKWKEDDPRDSYIVMITTDIMIYHLHARHNPKALTELRVKRYEDALKWLDDVMTGHESPGLPVPQPDPEDEAEGPVEYGFDMTPRQHYY